MLAWTTEGQDNPTDAPDSAGTVSFQETTAGLLNTDWSSNAPPQNFPILCASPTRCGNSLASIYYNVIWGSRVPVLAEPLLKDTTWSSTRRRRQRRHEHVDVPRARRTSRCPRSTSRSRRRRSSSDITQAGALGDPYGSGVRTIWWVYGVGPVKIEFDHAGGASRRSRPRCSRARTRRRSAADRRRLLPAAQGLKARVPLDEHEVHEEGVGAGLRGRPGRERLGARHREERSGPIKVAGAYGFTLRNDGLTNIGAAQVRVALEVPAARAEALPKRSGVTSSRRSTSWTTASTRSSPRIRRRPDSWTARRRPRLRGLRRHRQGELLGVQTVKVPAGRFQAIAVRTTLKQNGYKFGSGTRTNL